MIVVGLTGGIGCGKTLVTEHIRDKGVPVIDADQITRELTEPGNSTLAIIRDVFGNAVVDRDGRLQRSRLRQLIFKDPGARTRLEHILHPRVARAIQERLDALRGGPTPYCLVVVPLLVESHMESLVDRVLVVDCLPAQQIERVTRRDRCSEEHVQAIIDTQAAAAQRLAMADDVIQNRGSIESLYRRTDALHQRYRSLGGSGGDVPD